MDSSFSVRGMLLVPVRADPAFEVGNFVGSSEAELNPRCDEPLNGLPAPVELVVADSTRLIRGEPRSSRTCVPLGLALRGTNGSDLTGPAVAEITVGAPR